MKLSKGKRSLLVVSIVVFVVLIDQISKIIARGSIEFHSKIQLIGDYLVLTKVENTGAFLGMGDTIPRPIYQVAMILLPLLVIGYAFYYLLKEKEDKLSTLLVIGLSCFIGGGLGNIIDRIIFGSVTDFIHFDFVLFQTGILNLADVSITTGFFILLYDVFVNQKIKKRGIEGEGKGA